MFGTMQIFLFIILEILCCKFFYETFGDKRFKTWINVLLISLFAVVLFLTAYIFSNNFIIKQVVMIIILAIFMSLYIRIKFIKSLVLAILYQSLLLAIDYFAFSINSKLFKNSYMIEDHYYLEGVLVVLLGKTILFLCVLFIRKKFGKKSTEMLTDTEWIRLLFFPTFTIMVIASMLSVFASIEESAQTRILFIIAFGIVGMNILVFYLIDNIIERETKLYESKLLQLQVKNQINMYQSISDNFNKQKQKTHEYKNQIICIESLLAHKNYTKLESYVQSIYGNLNKELDAINTNNSIVNAILNTKYQEAIKKDIVFVFKFNDLTDIGISDGDIITILSNLLDNAIEACENCPDDKIIKFKLVKEDGELIISVKNTFNHELNYENGEIKTTKTYNPEEHGVGIKNVIQVVKKHHGVYAIKDYGKEFLFSIIIPLKS